MNLALKGKDALEEAIGDLQKAFKFGHSKECQWGVPESHKFPISAGAPYLYVCRCPFKYVSGALMQLDNVLIKKRK